MRCKEELDLLKDVIRIILIGTVFAHYTSTSAARLLPLNGISTDCRNIANTSNCIVSAIHGFRMISKLINKKNHLEESSTFKYLLIVS